MHVYEFASCCLLNCGLMFRSRDFCVIEAEMMSSSLLSAAVLTVCDQHLVNNKYCLVTILWFSQISFRSQKVAVKIC